MNSWVVHALGQAWHLWLLWEDIVEIDIVDSFDYVIIAKISYGQPKLFSINYMSMKIPIKQTVTEFRHM